MPIMLVSHVSFFALHELIQSMTYEWHYWRRAKCLSVHVQGTSAIIGRHLGSGP